MQLGNTLDSASNHPDEKQAEKRGGDMTMMAPEERMGRLEAELAGTNRRLDDTNKRLDDSNTRQSETNSRLDKVIFMLFGIGAGVIATLVTVIFALITND